ncbi:MAG: TonB-dependent receptor, partial [Alphaproteobacteria bacterium]|nr:TonB-dependent receptor [Alphaproteobacteria bacterium]
TVTGTHSRNVYQSHEIRLASDRRIANIFDYTAGFFTLDTPTDNTVTYPGGNPVIIANGDRKESSIYGNVTAHFTSKLEVSGGIRKILKSSNQSLTEVLPNTVLGNAYLQYKPTIWTASVSYHFTPAFMAYINAGTSFRQGTDSVGPVSTPGGYSIYSVDPGGVAGELNYVNLQPEYSHSYEVGLKSQFHEKRGTFNFDYFHQTFSNFLYANANNVNVNGYGTTLPPPPTTPLATWLASFKYDPVGSAPSSGFGSNVPVTVDGVEADASYIFSPNFNLAASASYVRSKITGGTIACNSTDIGAKALLDANGLPSIYACPGNGPASFVSPFGMTVQGEYSHQLDDAVMGYVRGLVDFKGATLYNPGDPANQQKAYALINIYAGIRNVRKGWDVNFFVKNLANTQVMLAAYGGNNPESSITGAVSPAYSTVAVAPPRQFGINLRYEFGSK